MNQSWLRPPQCNYPPPQIRPQTGGLGTPLEDFFWGYGQGKQCCPLGGYPLSTEHSATDSYWTPLPTLGIYKWGFTPSEYCKSHSSLKNERHFVVNLKRKKPRKLHFGWSEGHWKTVFAALCPPKQMHIFRFRFLLSGKDEWRVTPLSWLWLWVWP